MADKRRTLKPRTAATVDKAPAAAAAQEAPQADLPAAGVQTPAAPAEPLVAVPAAPAAGSINMGGPGMLYPPGTAPAQPEPNLAAIVDRDELIIVTVPRSFTLRIDNATTRDFKAGVQRMPRWMAEHWYSKAHGVTIFKG